jgi:hypothetical protein
MQRWFERADAERIVHIAGENWLSQSIADALNSRSGYEILREVVQRSAPLCTVEPHACAPHRRISARTLAMKRAIACGAIRRRGLYLVRIGSISAR